MNPVAINDISTIGFIQVLQQISKTLKKQYENNYIKNFSINNNFRDE